MSIDAMNAEEMNVKDIETILMKIDRQRCVTVVDTSSDNKPVARIDINEPPRNRTKSTESIEHFNPLNDVSDENAPPPEADVGLTKPSLDTSSVAFTSQDAFEISVFPYQIVLFMPPLNHFVSAVQSQLIEMKKSHSLVIA
jgi:hypothetical protein